MAAGEVYVLPGTQVLFGSEVGDDVAWTTESVADGAGRQSATYDAGGGVGTARPNRYLIEFWTQLQATPTVGNAVRLYLKEYGSESGTPDHPTNDDGSGDIAVSAEDKLRNPRLLDSIIVDEAAANVEMGVKLVVEIDVRHFALVLWNGSGATTSATASATKARVTPLPYQVQ